MAVRVYKRPRSSCWWADVRLGSVRVRESTGSSDYAEAKAWAQRRLVQLGSGRTRGAAPVTLGQAVEAYGRPWVARRAERKPEYGRNAESQLVEIVGYFGESLPLPEIRPGRVRAFAEHLANAGRSDCTVNRYLSALHVLLDEAAADEAMPGVPTFKRAWRREHAREFVFTDEQVRRMIELASPALRRAITLAAETGMRRAEMESLTWGMVDLSTRRITLQGQVRDGRRWKAATKSARGRVVPLTEKALDVLRELRELRGRFPTLDVPWVLLRDDGTRHWVLRNQSERSAFKRLCVLAGVPAGLEPHFHDLRAWRGTRNHRLGMVAEANKAMLGHSTDAAHKRYLRLIGDDVQRELDRVENRGSVPREGAHFGVVGT